MQQPVVHIYTDGSWKGSTRCGGYSALMISGPYQMIVYGAEANTTNQRMELSAVLAALDRLSLKSKVYITSDSEYVVKNMQHHLADWVRRGWRTSARTPVMNQDLWQRIYDHCQYHHIIGYWVRGHNGHEPNEVADWFAQNAYDLVGRPEVY